ncbi:MAG: HAMP domain-containing sensor histidine kinase [Candidatus Uhrbacteria bacterium]
MIRLYEIIIWMFFLWFVPVFALGLLVFSGTSSIVLQSLFLLVLVISVFIFILFYFQLQSIMKELESGEKLKDNFISIASHQLRAPLSSVKWYAELLHDGKVGILKKKQKEYIDRVFSSVERLVFLVDDFLDVSRIEDESFAEQVREKKFDPASLMENIVTALADPIKKKKITIKFKNESKHKYIKANPEIVREIYTNLITNAIKYNDQKGYIFIRFFDQKDMVYVEITDTGVGIPKSEQKKVFSKFFRGANVIEGGWQGTGLGLYAVDQLVDQIGGKISFSSKENKGTTFFVGLFKAEKAKSKIKAKTKIKKKTKKKTKNK